MELWPEFLCYKMCVKYEILTAITIVEVLIVNKFNLLASYLFRCIFISSLSIVLPLFNPDFVQLVVNGKLWSKKRNCESREGAGSGWGGRRSKSLPRRQAHCHN